MLKKQMVWVAIFLTLIISKESTMVARADEIPKQQDYTLDVGNKYVFVMLSTMPPSSYATDSQFDENIRNKYSQSGLYSKDDALTPIWTVDWYSYDFLIDISFDGKYLIEWAYLSYYYSKYDSIAFTLFEDGQEIRKYTINEFVSFPFLLSSPYEWKENSFIQNEKASLWIRTSNGEEYTIDLASGEIVKGISPKTKITILAVGMSFLMLVVVFAVWRVFKRAQPQKQI
jgi:hypothetical protein